MSHTPKTLIPDTNSDPRNTVPRNIDPSHPDPSHTGTRRSRARSSLAPLLAIAAAPIALALVSLVAPDRGRAIDTTGLSERLTQEQRDWVRELRAGNGASCCDDADGIDPEWDIAGGEYRVRYGGRWLVVAPHALLTQPNRIGVARAWIAHGEGETFVRCFLPGPTT
ncbi:hypothetical protein RA307_29300 [Xanthobacteraceae bacterium Astr-EGSB]|uniref:hypothetical protein n=1 Tax=Astrobacterium formosum TaxID=3069710 RepID=UPI0027B4E792|nr:hypothetical protein [Xanthobacteraceae bacterium Astr-EGSB]